MIPAAAIIFFICFAFIASQRYIFSLAIFLFLLPTYLIRYKIFGVPTTLLEGMFWILFILWVAREIRAGSKFGHKSFTKKISRLYAKNKTLFWGAGVFALAATLNIFFAADIRAALGMWKAFYIEPLLFAVIIATTIRSQRELHAILYGLVFSGLATGALVLYQHYTGWMVPWDFWQNNATYRVTGWWGFPNGVGFYCALILPFAVYLALHSDLGFSLKKLFTPKTLATTFLQTGALRALFIVTAILAFTGILFAKSTGALIGVVAGVGVIALVHTKTRWPAIALAVIALAAIAFAPAQNSFRQELLLQDRSGQTRIAMWHEALRMLRDRPIFGAGLASYKTRIEPYHQTVRGEGIEIFHHPHHQFLTFWSEIGIAGALAFVWLTVWIVLHLIRRPGALGQTLLFVFVTFLIMGMVDSPYIKNDTSIIFWLLPALLMLERDIS